MRLFAVIHSPFCDDHRLYCDRCPKAIEISYYDPAYSRAVDPLSGGPKLEQVAEAVEPLLRSCACDGRFRFDAPRHCFRCGAEVPAAANKDLSPYFGCEDGKRDPTPEEEAGYARFDAEFIRREDLWAAIANSSD